MHTLNLLGGAVIEGPRGPLTGRIGQRRQLALLAFLAVERRPVSRDRVIAVFWPETTSERGRHSLSDALYIIRKALGEGAVRTLGDDLQLDESLVGSDVAAFRAALEGDRLEEADSLYRGPLLEGFHLNDGAEFEHWLERERSCLAGACQSALETLAGRCDAAGDRSGAVKWWRRASVLASEDSRIALGLGRALAAAGDRAGAIRCLESHAALLREDLGIAPPPEVAAFAAELVSHGTQPARAQGAPRTAERPARHPSGPAAKLGAGQPSKAPEDSGAQDEHLDSGAPRALEHAVRRGSRAVAGSRITAFAALLFVCAAAAVLAAVSRRPSAGPDDLDTSLVAAFPLRVDGLSPDLAYLHEGMVELLAAKLMGEAGDLRAVPPGDVLAAWHRAVGRQATELPQDSALALARGLGAGRLLLGAAVGVRAQLSVHMRLLDARTGGELGRADGTGGESELHALVDRLVAELLSRSEGVEEHRLAHLTSTSLPALRAFLSARAAHRRGDYPAALHGYGRALELDSTFALAGLGAVMVGGWVGGSGPIASRGSAVARRHADRLSERDRVGLLGRLRRERDGPVTGHLQREERAAALAVWRDHARLWYLQGDLFLHQGAALGVEDRSIEARQSFANAIRLDADYADPVHHLATVLAEMGDTAELRRLVADQLARVPAGPVADYLRWIAHHRLDNPAFRAPPLDSMDIDATLRWIGIVAQDYGFALTDGAAAARLRAERSGIRDERLERLMGALAWALNGGRPAEAVAVLRQIEAVQPDPGYVHRLAILTALYAGGDEPRAVRAARQLAASPGQGPTGELNRCVLAQWQLRNAPEDVPRPDLLSDEEAMGADSNAWAVPRRLCTLVVDAQWLAAARDTAATAAVRRLDRLLDTAPILGLVDDGHSEYVHLATARLHEDAGRPEDALRALSRRACYEGWQPYLASILRAEGRLAAALGDTVQAVRAWTHWLEFRAAPEPQHRTDAERVRAGLGRLVASR